jgi:hypothetical protein
VGAYDVARLGDGYYPTIDREDLERPSATAEAIRHEPLLAVPVHGPRNPQAAADLRGSGTFGRDALALVSHSLNIAWGVRSPLLYVGLQPRRSQSFEERATNTLAASLGSDGVSRPGPAWAAAVGATGARFVTSFVPLEAAGLEEAFRAEVSGFRAPVHVYRNLRARPRALLIADARDVRGEDEALRALFQSPDFDPGTRSFVEGARDVAVPPAAGGAVDGPPGTARVVRDEAMHVDIDVDARRDAWLVVTDAPLAGWRAFLDGAETRVLPADVLCRAVPIPHGRHKVAFEYDPPGRIAGWVLTGAGLAAIAGLFALALVRRKAKHSAVSTQHSA